MYEIMEYKLTAITQASDGFNFLELHFKDPEISNCEDVKNLYTKAYGIVSEHLDSLDGAIKTADSVTLWRHNIFGRYSIIDRPQPE